MNLPDVELVAAKIHDELWDDLSEADKEITLQMALATGTWWVSSLSDNMGLGERARHAIYGQRFMFSVVRKVLERIVAEGSTAVL